MASLFIGRCKYRCKYPKCTNAYYTDIVDNFYQNKHFYTFPKKTEFKNEWRRICNINQDIKCDYFRVCEDHFEPKHFVNISKNKLNWNAIPIESSASLSSNIQLEKPLTSERENICCRTFLMNKNVDEASPIGANNINHNEATRSTIHDISCIFQTSSINIYPALNSDFAPSVTQSTNLTENHEDNKKILVSDKNIEFLVDDEMHNKIEKGYLKDIGLSQKQLLPKKQKMYKIHRNAISKLSKSQKLLKNERQHVTILKDLYDRKKFQLIDDSLNTVTKHFIESQIRNANRKFIRRRWTIKDKTFTLLIYKRSS